MSTDTSRTIEIEGSRVKLVFAAVACLMFAVLGGAIAFGTIHTDPRVHANWVGAFCLLLFGTFCVVAVRRLIIRRGSVVTISPAGIRDIRVAAQFIPWRAIQNISTWQLRQTRVMVLAVDPAIESTLGLTRAARWSRKANAMVGAKGLSVSTADLKIGHNALLALAWDYWTAYRAR